MPPTLFHRFCHAELLGGHSEGEGARPPTASPQLSGAISSTNAHRASCQPTYDRVLEIHRENINKAGLPST
jgi:hypothetical protein